MRPCRGYVNFWLVALGCKPPLSYVWLPQALWERDITFFIGLVTSSDHVMKRLLSRWWSLIRSHQSVMFSSLGYEYEYGDISLLICYVSSTDQQIKGVTLQYGWWHFTLGDNLVKLCGCEHEQCRDTLLFICYLSTRNHTWPLKYGN